MYPKQVRRTGMKGEATYGQVRLANLISEILQIDLPNEKTKQAYSDFINRYSRRYKTLVEIKDD